MRWTRIWQPFRANLSIYWFYWFFAILDHGVLKTCLLGFLNTLNKNDNHFAQNIDSLILSIFPHFRSGTDKDISSWVSQFRWIRIWQTFCMKCRFFDFIDFWLFRPMERWRHLSWGSSICWVWIWQPLCTNTSIQCHQNIFANFRPQVDGKRHLGFANMLITKIMEILMNLSMIVIGLSSMM